MKACVSLKSGGGPWTKNFCQWTVYTLLSTPRSKLYRIVLDQCPGSGYFTGSGLLRAVKMRQEAGCKSKEFIAFETHASTSELGKDKVKSERGLEDDGAGLHAGSALFSDCFFGPSYTKGRLLVLSRDSRIRNARIANLEKCGLLADFLVAFASANQRVPLARRVQGRRERCSGYGAR